MASLLLLFDLDLIKYDLKIPGFLREKFSFCGGGGGGETIGNCFLNSMSLFLLFFKFQGGGEQCLG